MTSALRLTENAKNRKLTKIEIRAVTPLRVTTVQNKVFAALSSAALFLKTSSFLLDHYNLSVFYFFPRTAVTFFEDIFH